MIAAKGKLLSKQQQALTLISLKVGTSYKRMFMVPELHILDQELITPTRDSFKEVLVRK